jgi:hypothetical protein
MNYRIGVLILIVYVLGLSVHAQVRGVYPAGMSSTNSGITPGPGFLYSNNLLIYTRSTFRDRDGKITATGNNSVILDMNSLVWVSKKEFLGGAKFSMSATLPIAKNSLTNDATGPVSGGSSLGDQYYQPVILGWNKQRFAVRAVYGFLAPTARFKAGANNNVGSGYWTHALSSGQTVYLTKDKATTFSAFQMYEIHTEQQTTKIHPGQTFNLDYSLMHTLPIGDIPRLQIGLIGYLSRQTTDKRGPNITSEQAKSHYKVNAIGFMSGFNVSSKVNVGFKYFKEFSNRSTFEGYSVQVSGSIKF